MAGIAASNIALPAYTHVGLLPLLPPLGITGLEVAPSRIWPDTWRGLSHRSVEAYRRDVEAAGLRVVGLHSLFFDHPELGLFEKSQARRDSIEFLAHLSGICRDLGGRTLIWGGNRRRRELHEKDARIACRSFLDALLPQIEAHGTKLCFEPLGPRDTDFLNSAAECAALTDEINHPALGIQLDAKALVENTESSPATFERIRGRIDHFHANDPGLLPVGSTRTIDHASLGACLRAIEYDGWVSIEQRMLDNADPIATLGISAACIRDCYFPRI